MQYLFITSFGRVKRNNVSDFQNIDKSGKIAINLAPKEKLIKVLPCNEGDTFIIYGNNNKATHLRVSDFGIKKGRNTSGIAGMKLHKGQYAIGAFIVNSDKIIVISKSGLGKLITDLKLSNKNTTGVLIGSNVISANCVHDGDNIFLFDSTGKSIRTMLTNIPMLSRQAKGVKLFATKYPVVACEISR